IEGMEADSTIRYWISKYLVILFLNLYTLQEYLITQRFLELPRLPDTLAVRKFLLEFIDYFNRIVKDVTDDTRTLKKIGFDTSDCISSEWCEKNDKTPPIKFVER